MKYLFRILPVFLLLILFDTACNRGLSPVIPMSPPATTVTPNATATLPVTATASPTATAPVSLTPTATFTPSAAPSLPAPACAGATALGPTSYSSPVSVLGGTVDYVLSGAGNSGTVTTLHFYIPYGSVTAVVGLYSDNGSQPGNLLSSSGSVSVGAGWNSVFLNNPVNVVGGNNYWLAVNTQSFIFMGGGTTGGGYLVQNTASLPSSFNNGGSAVTMSGWLAIYADICPGATVTPTASVTQSATATWTPTLSPTTPVTFTSTPTPTPSWTGLVTASPSATAPASQTATDTWTPTRSPTTPVTFTPTPTPSASGFVLTKSESNTSLTSNQAVTYTLSYSYSGAPVTGVVLEDTVPDGIVYSNYEYKSDPSFARNGSLLTWTFAGPVSNVSGTVNWVGMAVTDCSVTGPVTNIASATGAGMAPVQSNAVVVSLLCSTETAVPTASVQATFTPTATATFPVTQAGTPTWTPTPLSCSQQAVWGASVTMGYGVTIWGGNTFCQKYALAQDSVVDQVHFNIISYNYTGSMAVGIYTDGGSQPSGLVWNSGLQSVATGWNTVGVPQVQLAAGNYWLAVYTSAYVMLASDSASTSVNTWEPLMFPNPFLNPAGPFPTPTGTPPAGGYGPPPSSLTQSPAALYADICD